MSALLALALQVAIDRDALREFLEKKNLKTFAFDLDYLATMPPANVASHVHPDKRNGKLAIFVDVLKDTVTFPDRMQALASRCAKSLPDLFACAEETLGRAPRKIEKIEGEPIARIKAAIATGDPATICRIVLEVRDRLTAYEDDDLVIDVEGDDVHDMKKHPKVFIDLAGNDRYNGPAGATNGGLAMLFDFAGNDVYVSTDDLAQGAAFNGVALLYDAAGNDSYTAVNHAQGWSRGGIAALVDVSGNDTYEMVYAGQGCGEWDAFAILIDYDGDDSYLGHDPLYGHKVTVPAPQDEKHNVSMLQGAGTGYNAQPQKAGGVGICLDVRGDDTYRAGCWAQGVGYFMGLGALIDLEGEDTYQSWVYVMGSGAHGGFGLQVDAKGNDVYTIGGWNSCGMAVDFGCGMFLDGAGNDRYGKSANGTGRSIGLGVAVFQDSGGDDDYTTCDGKLGWGQWYEVEDYNSDGKITPPESMHWGIFFDLGGSDRYPAGFKNATRWDGGAYWGGIDRASPANPLVTRAAIQDWEDQDPAVVFAQLKKIAGKDDQKALADFGFAHGFVKDASEALFKSGGTMPGCAYDAALRLWIPEADLPWAAKLAEYRKSKDVKVLDGPKWVRRECREILLDRIRAWTASLKPLVDKRAALDDARAKDEKALKKLWAQRRTGAIRLDPVLRDVAKELDRIDARWRADHPLVCNLAEDSLTLETFTRTGAERAALEKSREVEKANRGNRYAKEINDFRAMYGRPALAMEAKVEGKETKGKGVEPMDRAVILDPQATAMSIALNTKGEWQVVVGRKP